MKDLKSVIAVCLLLLFSAPASATSVLQLTFQELCQQSVLIFEGRVTQVEARQDPSTGFVWTQVKLEVIDNIHGPALDSDMELQFLGGTVNDLTLDVAEMRIPESDERGIYFVGSLGKRQIHPFVGWSQGHFIVKSDPRGQGRVFTQDHRPVLAIEQTFRKKDQTDLSRGVAGGVTVGARNDTAFDAMTTEQFKNIVRANLPPRTPDN
jgi:hypothetical protein